MIQDVRPRHLASDLSLDDGLLRMLRDNGDLPAAEQQRATAAIYAAGERIRQTRPSRLRQPNARASKRYQVPLVRERELGLPRELLERVLGGPS